MSHFPQTVSVTTLFIVSAAVFSVTSLSWYLATKDKKIYSEDANQDKSDVHSHKKSVPKHHTRYSTKKILTHKLRSYKTFLEAIRNGDIESAVQYGEEREISKFIAVITAILAQIPFGAESFRQELLNIFDQRCQQNTFLLQSFQFFLYSYFNQNYVELIWNKHPIYQFILNQHRNNENDENNNNKNNINRQKSKLRMKKPKMVQVKVKDLIEIRQKQILYKLYNSLNEKKNLNANENGFKLSKKCKLKQKIKKHEFIVNELEYDGQNVLELFEIFTFKYIDNETKENDDIYEKIKINITAGFKVNIQRNIFCDPINGNNNLTTIQVQSIYNSNAKPLLLSLYCNNLLSSQMIFKKGDDLRKDSSISTMFHLFNDIWKLNNLKYNGICVESFTYECIAMGEHYGCIQHISDCIPLTDIKKRSNWDQITVNKLIATAVGSYIGAFIMGIRDRHSDNILIRKDGTLFHIDYGYVLGEKLSGLDASKFAITQDLQSIMGGERGKGWNNFVHYCVLAICLLRDNYQNILSFGKTALRFLEWHKIEIFLKEQLMIGASDSAVNQYLKEKINKAPNKWKTKMKNTIHSIAMNVKK